MPPCATAGLSSVGSVRSCSRLDLPYEILRVHEEIVLDQDAADDHRWMRTKNIEGVRRRQHICVEGADHRVVEHWQRAIEAHLVFHPTIAARPVVYGRFDMRDHPRQGQAESGSGIQCLLDEDESLLKRPALR